VTTTNLLDTIDTLAVHRCAWCDTPLADNSQSPDYCGPDCQQKWTARHREVVELTGYREPEDHPAYTGNLVELSSPEVTPADPDDGCPADCGCPLRLLLAGLERRRRALMADAVIAPHPDHPNVLQVQVRPAVTVVGEMAWMVQRMREQLGRVDISPAVAAVDRLARQVAENTAPIGDRVPARLGIGWVVFHDDERRRQEIARAFEVRRAAAGNHGPELPQRAPRRIDPRGTR
jgi:hypothetical protein